MRGFLIHFHIDLRKGRDVVHKPPSCAVKRDDNRSDPVSEKGKYSDRTRCYRDF